VPGGRRDRWSCLSRAAQAWGICGFPFLNVIESVFSGMARAIIHNGDYSSVEECKAAIDRYFAERNRHFREHPKRAGNKLWGKELVPPVFAEGQNCKDPHW